MNYDRHEVALVFGSTCREARLRIGWTQEDAARRVGIGTDFYGRIERGQAMPGLAIVFRLADVLDFSLDSFARRLTPAHENAPN